ncbi:hypothetical protein HPO_00520 [Hyphomonas polymorpha PS728]|uniref:Tryptophan-rich sensory protein n=1 Tax=Hyphomonas polymorpha PS728 TaxID=1280954 RepID=A0A062VLA0_9PROT|nr:MULTISPECIES: hypothetical protein [Hyphomonas]AXE63249.1 hypothetical protein BBF93_02725 [Hyphomonas sp. CACIAM 19H1]KDA00467.1 hypothetical protein HPO_00520 [Hyphomonas polymorpha PS728]
MQSRTLPLLVLIVGILQPLAGALAPLTGIGIPVGDANRAAQAPEQPMPLFFSIWGVIFAVYIAFGLAGLRKPESWPQAIGLPLLLAGVGNIIWMLSAQLLNLQLLNFILLGPIFLFAWLAARSAHDLRGGAASASYYIGATASGLLAGWISAATAVSIPLTIRNLTGLGETDFPWPMFWATLGSAGVFAWLFASRISASLWYFAALGWGILGIAFHNWVETGMHLIGHIAFGCLILLLLVRLTRGAKPVRPAP